MLMWMIMMMGGILVPLLGLAAYAIWRERKYDEYYKTHEHEEG
jgi:heme/copper-type cytochrome/quinol oxidase subunit 2